MTSRFRDRLIADEIAGVTKRRDFLVRTMHGTFFDDDRIRYTNHDEIQAFADAIIKAEKVSSPAYKGQYTFDRPLSRRKKLLWWGLAMLVGSLIWLAFILLALRAM